MHFFGDTPTPSRQRRNRLGVFAGNTSSERVSGVFFAPLEYETEAEKMNRRILSAFEDARIPIVLLDRRASKTLGRKRPDLVGINNRQAAYTAAEHLISLGCRRIAFLSYHGSASTINERSAGYSEALADHGLKPAVESVSDGANQEPVRWTGKDKLESIEAFVCVNDRIAGQLMHLFLTRNIRVPDDVRIVGIDDVSYASLLPVPLTTIRQPTHEIGEAGLRAMLDRIHMPHMPPREILLDGELIVRRSCGASLSPHHA
jgi:GntR family transcriptional regulator of arabinose operon